MDNDNNGFSDTFYAMLFLGLIGVIGFCIVLGGAAGN
jgi:hypothetical protein